MNAKERAGQLLGENRAGIEIARTLHDEEYPIEEVHDSLFNLHFVVIIENPAVTGKTADKSKILHVAPRPEPGTTMVIVVDEARRLPGIVWKYDKV